MEAGYDYLLVRARLQQSFIRTSAILLAVTGAILLVAGISYFVYAAMARSGLDDLNYAVTVPQSPSEIITVPPNLAPTFGATTSSSPTVVAPVEVGSPAVVPAPAIIAPASQETVPALPAQIAPTRDLDLAVQPVLPPAEVQLALLLSPNAIAAQQLYPGEAIKATYWANPLEYEPASFAQAALLRGFKPMDSSQAAAPGTLPPPTRIVLPSIAVDSGVKELAILNLGDSRAYETPNHVVGHIPVSSNPGELGSVWLFGHLESPIAGEGNVFYNLPQVPDLLRKGEDVFIIVENGQASYLYQITESFVVHQSDLSMDYESLQTLRPEYAQLDPGGANIHLVACVPRFVYDSRLVVSGKLVGKS